MAKAVLVMDMPECCADCQLADDDPSGLYCVPADEYYEVGLKEGRITEKFKMPDSLIPEIYGTIEKKPDGTLYTTKAQRTGCSMCGFGIHMEKRPHRFDLLHESNPKEWDYLMFHMCKDKDGNNYGWAKVLDYIGVGWDPTTIGGNCRGQMNLEDFMK